MADVYDLMFELLLEGHGDKIKSICSWYIKYEKAGLSHQESRMLLVKQGYLANPLDDFVEFMKKKDKE